MLASIFNDVISPVMRGPSSWHCAAALRIARLARDLMGGAFDEVLVEFDRNGSLPTTHDTQGSDWGLGAGVIEGKSSMGVIVAAPPAGASAQRLRGVLADPRHRFPEPVGTFRNRGRVHRRLPRLVGHGQPTAEGGRSPS